MPKNGVFKVQFHNKNLALKCQNGRLKCQNGQQKCLNWQNVAQYLWPKNWHFYRQNLFFGIFTPLTNAGIKAFVKLTPGKRYFCLTKKVLLTFFASKFEIRSHRKSDLSGAKRKYFYSVNGFCDF